MTIMFSPPWKQQQQQQSVSSSPGSHKPQVLYSEEEHRHQQVVGDKGSADDVCLVDYRNTDYRGFLFVVHETYGLLLLRCTRKKNKGPHWQVPGGHVDEPEFLQAAKTCRDKSSQLQLACKMGAARELFEETGLDFRMSLNRILPASLRPPVSLIEKKNEEKEHGKKEETLINEHKDRFFFFLAVNDQDFPSKGGVAPMGNQGSHLRIKLSHEHSGFLFQPEPREAAEMLKLHSGGKVTEALLMAMERDNSGASNSSNFDGSSSSSSAVSVSSPQVLGDDHSAADATNDGEQHQQQPPTTPLQQPNNNTIRVESAAAAAAASSASSSDITPNTRRRRGKRDKADSSNVDATTTAAAGGNNNNQDNNDPSNLDLLPKPQGNGLFSCFFCW